MLVYAGICLNLFRFSFQAVFEGRIKDVALAVPLLCCAFDTFRTASKRQIIIAGGKDAADTQKLVAVCHSFYDPDKTVIVVLCI